MTNKRNIPTVIVVFGATGDLMARKITPALFHLYVKGKLPRMFRLIGVARRPLSQDEFRTHVMHLINQYSEHTHEREKAEAFIKLCFYHQGRFEERSDYNGLSADMGRIDNEWKICSNKLFYLAVPPLYYKTIFTHLHDSHLTDPCSPEEGWTRVLVEKPFGNDLKTAEELDQLLGKLFKEEQVYRIDHYLGKEMLQNILTFRFTNNFLEGNWNRDYIERIDIRLHESNGVEKRGAFYDGLGAFRDVGQNHLLQMMALITMENPSMFDASHIRANRSRILQTLVAPREEDIQSGTLRAQYEGYRDITGVHKSSTKETYFKVKTALSHPRWEGVPIYLSSGKRLGNPEKDITVTFRHQTPCLCPPGSSHYQNKVIFSLEPQEKITIQFFSKEPGLDLSIKEKDFTFLYRSQEKKIQYVEEYEKLLLDCIVGDQTLFVSTDEVTAMWDYTDRLVGEWEKGVTPLLTYTPDTNDITRQPLPVETGLRPVSTMPHEVGIVGLGKMGAGIARNLAGKGWRVLAWNRTQSVTRKVVSEGLGGIEGLDTIAEFSKKLAPPRVVLLSVSAGKAVQEVLEGLGGLEKGDIVIDAGNSFYQDSIRRAKQLAKRGIRFVDVGISGGPGGARNGACLMVGGDRNTYEYLKSLFDALAIRNGMQFFEGIGAGHFVKMIHNGIEYGMMQALAEGFAVMRKSPFKLDLTRVADSYNHGSVIQSRLVEWLKDAYTQYGIDLEKISGAVSHSGEGQWTVETARELGIETKIIEGSLQFRIDSAQKPSYTGKIVNALRGQFGGHAVEK